MNEAKSPGRKCGQGFSPGSSAYELLATKVVISPKLELAEAKPSVE